MKFFSGSSNEPLAKKIAKLLKLKLGDVEITRFIDNECRVYVRENVDNKEVFVVQSLSAIADQHLVELCLLGQALKSLSAKKITAVIPWMGYSKQDKAFRKGEAISAQLVAKFIEAAGFDAVVTVELHSENVVPYFKIPVVELSTTSLFQKTLAKHNHTVVVSPDRGGKSRSMRFARLVNLPIAYLSKTRDLQTGKVEITDIEGDVKDKTVVIFDDIINTGSTAIKSAQFVKRKGAKKIIFLATHPVLAGDASEKLRQSPIDEIVVSDTIFVPKEKMFAKLKILSCSRVLVDAISYPQNP